MRSLAAQPSTISEEFWDAAAQHRLVVPQDSVTGRYFFPPETISPATTSNGWTFVASPGLGVVTTFSVVHRSPTPQLTAPYVLAVVALDEGWEMLTNIVDCGPDSVFCGMRVGVRFLDVADARSLPVFGPVSPIDQSTREDLDE